MTGEADKDIPGLEALAQQNPDNIEAWLDLCERAELSKNYAAVFRAGEALVRLAPDKPQPHYIRALALHRLRRIEEAILAYKQVLKLHPNYVDAWVNLGECCQFLNHVDEAHEAYLHAVDASGQGISYDGTHDFDEADLKSYHWNVALIELLKGDYINGFARYPARFRAIAGRKRPDFVEPLWRGQDLSYQTLLITVDQGHGDTLLMARYLPLLRARGARVLFQVQPALASYFKGWDGADLIINEDEKPFPRFDFHASEFDLPQRFGTTLATIPSKVPYLPVPTVAPEAKLPEAPYARVGVTWSGNAQHRNDIRRSIPLAEMANLFSTKEALFFGLNRDLRAGDKEILGKERIIDLSQALNSFEDTAKFITQMDLIITCDTAVAHLAGGMGKVVWVLLPFAPSWCWLLDRSTSPWYPTARLFRQRSLGDWGNTLDDVKVALSAWLQQQPPKAT